jgi:hypothetical protein
VPKPLPFPRHAKAQAVPSGLPKPLRPHIQYIQLNPAAIPAGDGVGIFTNPDAGQSGPLAFGLVRASQTCTGS